MVYWFWEFSLGGWEPHEIKYWMLAAGLWLLSIKPINILFIIPVFIQLTHIWSIKEKTLTICPFAKTSYFHLFFVGWIGQFDISWQLIKIHP
ncbi:MAG: hypothetical protein JEZ06_01480 [Anaerolineaceae bacterium]|nr:hypothetical protein [Anaerolineaceae bacterium]